MGIQVIARAADILRALKSNSAGMSLGQIANRVQLPRSTVQRIVSSLQAEEFVIADANNTGFKIGPGINALGKSIANETVEMCRPLLVELTQATGETADLSVMRGDKMVFLDQVPGMHRLRTVSFVGEVFPLTTTANGRACLAKLPEPNAREIALKEFRDINASSDINVLMKTLDAIKEDGLAYDRGDHSDGISAIGFAFRSFSGELHAISVPVPTSRFTQNKTDIEHHLKLASKRVSNMFDT